MCGKTPLFLTEQFLKLVKNLKFQLFVKCQGQISVNFSRCYLIWVKGTSKVSLIHDYSKLKTTNTFLRKLKKIFLIISIVYFWLILNMFKFFEENSSMITLIFIQVKRTHIIHLFSLFQNMLKKYLIFLIFTVSIC